MTLIENEILPVPKGFESRITCDEFTALTIGCLPRRYATDPGESRQDADQDAELLRREWFNSWADMHPERMRTRRYRAISEDRQRQRWIYEESY